MIRHLPHEVNGALVPIGQGIDGLDAAHSVEVLNRIVEVEISRTAGSAHYLLYTKPIAPADENGTFPFSGENSIELATGSLDTIELIATTILEAIRQARSFPLALPVATRQGVEDV